MAVVADGVVVLVHGVVVAELALEEIALPVEACVVRAGGTALRLLRWLVGAGAGATILHARLYLAWPEGCRVGALLLEILVASLLGSLVLLVPEDVQHLLDVRVLRGALRALARLHVAHTELVPRAAVLTLPIVLAHLTLLNLRPFCLGLQGIGRLPVFDTLLERAQRDLLDLQGLEVLTGLDITLAARTLALRLVDDIWPAAAVAEPHRHLGIRLRARRTARGLERLSPRRRGPRLLADRPALARVRRVLSERRRHRLAARLEELSGLELGLGQDGELPLEVVIGRAAEETLRFVERNQLAAMRALVHKDLLTRHFFLEGLQLLQPARLLLAGLRCLGRRRRLLCFLLAGPLFFVLWIRVVGCRHLFFRKALSPLNLIHLCLHVACDPVKASDLPIA